MFLMQRKPSNPQEVLESFKYFIETQGPNFKIIR